MAPYLSQFRELYHELLDVESRQIAPMLMRWARENRAILESYRKYQRLNAFDNVYDVENDELHSLYALSRVCDVLILPFQPGESWFDLSRAEFVEFWQMLGVESSEPRDYHPFWCEIVACQNGADDDAPPIVSEILWPALKWGEMLVCRAGVRVSAGWAWMDAKAATHSPLYFASRRNYRPAHDLSHGWGSNSQWGTEFRRDYVWGEHYVFNADGLPDLGMPEFLASLSAHEWAELLMSARRFFASSFYDWGTSEIGLSPAKREALLVNRCQLCAPVGDEELEPWHDTAIWRRDAPIARAC